MKLVALVLGLLLLASCGGAAAPSVAPSSLAASASAGAASVKPAASSVSASAAAKISAKPAASGAATGKPQAKLTIAAPSATLTLSPTLIADKKGFFAEQGLSVELVYAGSGSKAAAAVVGGSAQVGASDLGDLLGAVEGGQDIRVFAAIGVEPVYVTVLRRSVAEKLNLSERMPMDQRMKAVKGLKFAISTPGSGTDSMLHYLLALGGLDPERDVQILTTGAVVNSYAAAVQGAADGASLSPPTGEQALVKDNMFPLMNTASGDLPQLNGQLQNGLWATGKWLDSNPQVAAAATAAMWKTYDYIKKNPQEAAELVHKAAWESTEQRVYDLAWKDATPSFPDTPAVSTAGLQKLLEFTRVTQKKELKVTPEKAIDPKPVEGAKALLGR